MTHTMPEGVVLCSERKRNKDTDNKKRTGEDTSKKENRKKKKEKKKKKIKTSTIIKDFLFCFFKVLIPKRIRVELNVFISDYLYYNHLTFV